MSEQSFAVGTKVKFKSTSCYARRWPGVYVVEETADNPEQTYLEGHVTSFQTSHLELAPADPASPLANAGHAAPAQPVQATVAAVLPTPAAKPITPATTMETAMTQTSTSSNTSAKGQPPAGAIQSVDGWRAEFRASPALQAEYLTEDSYVATRKFDAKRAGVRFNRFSAAEADQQADPHVAAWMRDPALQAEFLTPQAYSAFARAEERGSAKILRRPGA